jgi:hypothetical protein
MEADMNPKVQGGRGFARHHRVCVTAVLAALLVSCATQPTTPNRFGHYHDYPYKTPAQVNGTDDEACGQRANSEAFASIRGMSDTPAVLFGPIGAAVQLTRANSKLNATYEGVMKSCLREKGYELAD